MAHGALLHAGQEADIPACVPPRLGGGDGVLVARGRAVAAADRAADQHRHPRAHVLLLLHVLHPAAAAVEEAGHPGPDHPVCFQVPHLPSLILEERCVLVVPDCRHCHVALKRPRFAAGRGRILMSGAGAPALRYELAISGRLCTVWVNLNQRTA